MAFLDKLKSGLSKTKKALFGQIEELVKVFVNNDDRPNTNPTKAPSLLPSIIPARITGICNVVARTTPIGTYPRGVTINTNSTAIKNDTITILYNFLLFIICRSFRSRIGCVMIIDYNS